VKCTAQVTVRWGRGIHLGSSAAISEIAKKFNCSTSIENRYGRITNAKSVLSLTALVAPKGSELTIHCDGEDAEEAIQALKRVFVEREET